MKKRESPAFPVMGDAVYNGLSIRQYYIGQALVGVSQRRTHVDAIVKESMEIADTLLIALEMEG